MVDFGRSEDPRVQAQLDRLSQLSVPQGRLGLETIRSLMERLGDPHKHLPPVFHVAGTNGKGSTCAFLRAMLEAQGLRVHVTTSPHLVRYNERIRVAGELISDERLAELLKEILDAGEDLAPSFFEVTIAAALTEFARIPADACVVEVGLGGRFDATNILEPEVLAACGVAALGLDHERFLLAPEPNVPTEPIARIAFEKAGIAKAETPLITLEYEELAQLEILWAAARNNAPLTMLGQDWHMHTTAHVLHYSDAHGSLDLPLPTMHGAHQAQNASLAIAMLRHQKQVEMSTEAIAQGICGSQWPARLQRLKSGPVTNAREVWLDGGHNASAGATLARHFAGQQLHLVIGMIVGKDPAALTGPLAPSIQTITAVPVPGHDHHPATAYSPNALSAPSVVAAIASLPDDGLPILVAGSLYLAGEVLRLNDEIPD